MKTAIAALVCMTVSAVALAAPERSNDEIKRGVADAVRRYANAIACPNVKVRPQDVLALVPSEDEPRKLSKYVVLWVGDVGCTGGTGMEASHLAIATVNNGKYVVDPKMSSPVVEFEAPVRVIKRVLSHTNDTLTLQGNVHGPQDTQNTPTVPVRFTLKMDEKGNWRMVEKHVLPLGTVGG